MKLGRGFQPHLIRQAVGKGKGCVTVAAAVHAAAAEAAIVIIMPAADDEQLWPAAETLAKCDTFHGVGVISSDAENM